MKKINGSVLFVVVVLLVLSGCSAHKPMDQLEMYQAPNFSEMMPANLTVVKYNLNPLLDVADTAFYPDVGIVASTTWPFYILPAGETDMEKAKRVWAIRFDLHPRAVLLIYFPEKLEKIKNDLGFLTDHAGKRIFSPTGQMVYVPGWEKINSTDFKDIIKPIGEMNVIEAERGSQAYTDLMTLLEPFKSQAEENWSEAMKVRDDYYRAYGIPVGSSLTKEQMSLLMKDDSFKEKLISFLGENWYGVITFPLWTPEQYGVSMLITKVFQIPTHFWSQDFDKPGYMDRKLTAIQGGVMFDYYDKNYGFRSMFSPEEVRVLQELARQLQQRQ